MSERLGRYRGEAHRHRTKHKISLTRLCLTSGTLQLPFALWNSLPGGELLVHDVHDDAPLEVRSQPPRRLSGLRGFFERHEVGVNDRLVLEFGTDEAILLRIETVARASGAAPAGEPARAPAPDEAQPPRAALPDETRVSAPPAQDQVVDRFGRVTVRRLGAGRGRPGPAPSEPARLPEPVPERAPAPPAPEAQEASQRQASGGEHRPSAPAEAPEPRERSDADDRSRSFERPLFAPQEAPQRADAPAPAEVDEGHEVEARRARLNASGDLRTQVVRYLIEPETPVIVRVEHVAQRFSLTPSVAREVLAGIQHDPPPTLAVEAVRHDMYRISRATVEQEA